MSKSTYQFNRWTPRSSTSWVYRVFKQHSSEFLRMYTAFENSYKYTYTNLKSNGSKWDDLPSKHFKYNNPSEYLQFMNIKDWSGAFNDLNNWMNLNALVTVSSNFETYLSTIISLALSSDVGVLYGIPKKVDGIEILKNGNVSSIKFEDIIISCTKGVWSSRTNAYKKIFSSIPYVFQNSISSLEKIREIRNEVAHAFGRNIDESRSHEDIKTLPIRRINRVKVLKYHELIFEIVKSIDTHLLQSHIGEYQSTLFYHNLYPTLNHKLHMAERAMVLKKKIGSFGDIPAGKEFCKGLVKYYEGL